MKFPVILLAVLACTLPSAGQDQTGLAFPPFWPSLLAQEATGGATHRSAIKLGMSRSDVSSMLGTPQEYRPSHSPGFPPSTKYFDVYEIKTSMNTYELWIYYVMDDSESRLHPVPRVIAIHFELDKRVRINDVGKVLDDIPEIALLCGVECTVASGRTLIGEDRLNLHPRTVTSAEMAEAELIGSMIGRDPAGGSTGTRKPTAVVISERGLITQVIFYESDDHGEGPVQATWKPQRPAN